MIKLIRIILRGPIWVPFAAAAAVLGLGLALHQGFGLEAAPYARMARTAPPPVVALDRYRLPKGMAPQEARLRVQVMTGSQLVLRRMPRNAAAATLYFLPFTAPPGGAGEGRVLGGMILDKAARDAFVQWAVTKARPELANDGVALTLAGLTLPEARVPLAGVALTALRARGIPVAKEPVFVTPYLGRRAAVLAMQAAQVRANPLPRIAYVLAFALLLFAINRYAQHRHENRPEPEPLSLAAIRDTAFERLMHLVSPPHGEAAADPAAARSPGATLAPEATWRDRAARRLRRVSRFAGLWLAAIGLGWALARIYPYAIGDAAYHAGVAAGPVCAALLMLRRVLLRRRAALAAPGRSVAAAPVRAAAGGERGRRKARRVPPPDPYELLQKRVAAGEA